MKVCETKVGVILMITNMLYNVYEGCIPQYDGFRSNFMPDVRQEGGMNHNSGKLSKTLISAL